MRSKKVKKTTKGQVYSKVVEAEVEAEKPQGVVMIPRWAWNWQHQGTDRVWR